MPDLCTRGALFTPGAQFSDGQGCAFGFHLDASIASVADPATHSQVDGAAITGCAEPHALHATLDDQAPAFGKGLETGRL